MQSNLDYEARIEALLERVEELEAELAYATASQVESARISLLEADNAELRHKLANSYEEIANLRDALEDMTHDMSLMESEILSLTDHDR